MPLSTGAAVGIAAAAVATAGVAWPAFWWWEVSRLEKPVFTVLRKLSDKSEVRAYAPYIIAEAEISDAESGGSMRQSMNSGFRNVAGFIFGGNERKESVAMTSPVRTERVESGAKTSEKIAMTSPVRTERAPSGGAYRVSFVMPRKYTLATIPAPKDSRVKLREVPAHVAAATWFTGGVADDEAMARKSAALEAELRAAGLTPEGPPLLANYYPPFAPNWLRHTEVLFRLKESAEAVEKSAAAAAAAAAAQQQRK